MSASDSRGKRSGASTRSASTGRVRFSATARLPLVILLLAAAGCRDRTACDRLVAALQRAEPQNLAGTVRAVNEAGQADRAAGRLVELLASRRSIVRASAAWALADLDAQGARIVPGLIQALRDRDPHVRAAATEALGKVRPITSRTAAAIVAMRDDQDERVRCASVEALAEAGPTALAAVPMLIAALQDPAVRRLAAEALGNIGEDARDAVPALVRASRAGDESARLGACRAIWKITRDARQATPPLPDLLDDRVFLPVRIEAASLAAEIGPPAAAATAPLVDMLGCGNEPAARAAAAALASIGREAAPLLEKAAASPDPTRRQFAVSALGQMARTTDGAQESLLRALSDQAWLVRLTAVRALASLARDRETKPLLDALRAAAHDPHPFVRTAAAGALDMLAERRGRADQR